MTCPVRWDEIENTPRRGTKRPVLSTSPSSAASSIDGHSKANGRIVDRRTAWAGAKTVFRIRNRNSTISFPPADAFTNTLLTLLLNASRTEEVRFRGYGL